MNIVTRTLKFTIGLALGAGLGAVAATLLAPQSGKVSRAQIRARLDDVVQAGKEAQREREKELQDYWEKEINVKYDEKEKEKK